LLGIRKSTSSLVSNQVSVQTELESRNSDKILLMNNDASKTVISRSPDVMSGTPVFDGTRVPVQTLLDYLAGEHPLKDFLNDFPTVQHEQAVALLRELEKTLSTAQI